jgi:hypothetical protein
LKFLPFCAGGQKRFAGKTFEPTFFGDRHSILVNITAHVHTLMLALTHTIALMPALMYALMRALMRTLKLAPTGLRVKRGWCKVEGEGAGVLWGEADGEGF